MVREVAPNLSYHYWGLGIRGRDISEEADPLVLVRGSEFNHEREIEMEDDEGHMGTATTRMSSYRTKASANPSFTDKCRYKEGWEDVWLLLLGSDNGSGAIRKSAVTGASTVPQIYNYTFQVNVSNPQEPYFATLVNGFAKTTNDAYKYEDALLSEFELSGSNEEAPSYTVTFATNYPKFNQQNPARTFPARTSFPKSSDVRIYIAPVSDEPYTEDTIAQYEYPCYLDWSVSVNNNIESVPCSGDAFGESTKVLGNREGEVNITVPWTNATKHLEYEFEGGSATAQTVTSDNDVRTVWIIMESEPIKLANGNNSAHNYKTIIKIPKVVMTSAMSEQSGTDAKQIELSGNIEETSTESFMTAIVKSDLQDLHIDNTTGTNGSLYDDIAFDVTVTVTENDAPLSGATVQLGNVSATTSAEGTATFDTVPKGDATLKVTKTTYTPSTQTVTVDKTHNTFTVAMTKSS